MSTIVLVEGNFDRMFLAKLIAEEQAHYDVEIRVVGGISAFFSYARTLLAVSRIPVAVLMDADSSEPDAIEQRRSEAEEVIGDAANGVPFRVLVAVPTLEALFFSRPELLRRVFGEAVTDHLLELGQLSPKRTLARLGSKSFIAIGTDLLRQLSADDILALRQTDLIQDLLQFILSCAVNTATSLAEPV